MRFVDEVCFRAVAGDGGDGAVAFRREKHVPLGGPSGGDGGRGGSVILEGHEGLSTLLDLTYSREVRAERGHNGGGKDCNGRDGSDRIVRVPVGTQIVDRVSGALLGDLTTHGERLVVARGGRGGLGNIHFATPTERAPRKATLGEPGEDRELCLELKVLADVGLLGFPNVGKSTFIAAVSSARPKIADYPFTTLTPSLGVVEVGGGPRRGGTTLVMADIPGLIPGASQGAGLGLRFLRHLERTRALLHLVSIDPSPERDPIADYRALRRELGEFSPELLLRAEVVALSKADLPEVREAYPALREQFRDEMGIELELVGAATHEGLTPIVNQLAALARRPEPNDWSEPAALGPADVDRADRAAYPGAQDDDG